jgi:hypothetical protein
MLTEYTRRRSACSVETARALLASDRLLIEVTGDDGSTKLFYDGKTVVLFGVETKRYASLPVPNTIQGMMKEVMGRLGVDFPLADFLTDNPDKSFLFGVTSGREVNTVTIDGVPCRHLLFIQPPSVELELWVEKNDRSLPRRLIVTYRNLPGQPNFVAEFSGWDIGAAVIHGCSPAVVGSPCRGPIRCITARPHRGGTTGGTAYGRTAHRTAIGGPAIRPPDSAPGEHLLRR